MKIDSRLTIHARMIETNSLKSFEPSEVWIDGNFVYARLPDSDMVAELNLSILEPKWLIYPN